MTIWRDWSAVDSNTGKPRPGATHSWWHYCERCAKLAGPIAGPVGPRGWVSDSDEGVPDVVVEGARLRHTCAPEAPKVRLERAPQRALRVSVKPRWRPEEDAIVLAHSVTEAAKLLRRSVPSVSGRRKRLIADGILPRNRHASERRAWTEDENRLAATLPLDEVVRITGRSVKSVRARQWVLAKRQAAA